MPTLIFFQKLYPVKVSGATGPLAEFVNGTYTSTDKRLNGKTVYSKHGSTNYFLFRRKDLKWAAGATSKELIDNDDNAGVACTTELSLSHPRLAKTWDLFNGLKLNGEDWQSQPVVASIMVLECIFKNV